MKKQKVVKQICCLFLTAMLLTGCKGKDNTTKDTKETKISHITIDGDVYYYQEDDEEVQKIYEFVNEFIKRQVNRDYTNDNPELAFDLYIDEIKNQYKEAGNYDLLKSNIKKYEMQIELQNPNISKVDIYTLHGKDAANITIDYQSVIKHGTQEYLDMYGDKINDAYQFNMSLTIQKEDNEWKVYEASVNSKEKISK
ncbi:hypothetical protein lbkm_0778 [Lachnospiraceae bacterium KM106-2]|nr:hypothetical protein lbkm_0778 [Lachnospiraceae bacterium KM106-2]